MISISAVLFVPPALLFVLSFREPQRASGGPVKAGAALAIWALLTAAALLHVKRRRLEILPEGFRYSGLLGDKRYRYEDFSGYRVPRGRNGGRSANTLGVLYGSGGRARLTFGSLLERPREIREWIQTHFRDLDVDDAAEQKNALARLDATAPHGASLLRAVAKILNAGAFVLLLFLVVFANGFGSFYGARKALTLILLAIPLATLGLRARFGPLATFLEGAYRTRVARLGLSLLLPTFAGAALPSSFPPVHWIAALPWAVAAGLLFYLAVWRLEPRLVANVAMTIILLVASLSYGYGLVCYVNAALDRSDPTRESAVVRRRSVYRGRASVVVSSASDPEDTTTLEVPRNLEERLPPGQPVQLTLRPGALGIPWIEALEAAR